MAISLVAEKMIPAIALDKVHVLSWLQTEEQTSPYNIRIQAKVILYGHDADGNRVYDPAGPNHINVTDFRTMLSDYLATAEPADAAAVIDMNTNYVKAIAFMISLTTEYGDVVA